jgi:hypothetical protein
VVKKKKRKTQYMRLEVHRGVRSSGADLLDNLIENLSGQADDMFRG